MKNMKKRFLSALSVTIALLFFVGFAGCEKEGPAEKLGEKIDQSVEEVKDAVTSKTQ